MKKALVFKSGDKVVCSIQGKVIRNARVIRTKGGKWFICQNVKNGFRCKNTLGYKYSWLFTPSDLEEFYVDWIRPAVNEEETTHADAFKNSLKVTKPLKKKWTCELLRPKSPDVKAGLEKKLKKYLQKEMKKLLGKTVLNVFKIQPKFSETFAFCWGQAKFDTLMDIDRELELGVFYKRGK